MTQIILLFLLALFIRLIKIQDYLFFGFEQGRDLQIIQKIYQLKDFVLVGPSTSIGGIFHGPWYYYLLALPLALTSGNPLGAGIFLIILGSFLPLVIYLLAKDIFDSKIWGLIAGVITIFSYEYVLYARWLSNVSLSPLFIALSFLMLWKFMTTKSRKCWLGFAAFASIASLFEIILLPQFFFLCLLLLVFNKLKGLSLKTFSLSFLISLFLFGPVIVFDFRNGHIIFNSIINLGVKSVDAGGFKTNFVLYMSQLYEHLALAIFNIRNLEIQLFIIASILLGLGLSYFKKTDSKIRIFLLCWLFMSLPVMKISPGDPQHYVGTGLAGILLFCFSLKNLWQSGRFKYLSFIFVLLFVISGYFTLSDLWQNKNVFFRTTQEDLVYSDQKALLKFINDDANGNPYRLVSFTVPSLHPEGWEYLQQYFYPAADSKNAKIVYISIETGVFPVWEQKWIRDLGETRLEYERKFGLIRLQKRFLNNEIKKIY